MMARWRTVFWILIVGWVVGRAVVAEGLVIKSLYDFDEARYAEVAKNVVKSGEWLVPMAGGPDDPKQILAPGIVGGKQLPVYFWKPPLATWIMAVSYKVMGINELATRLPSLLFSILSLPLLWLIAKKITGGNAVGYLAVLIWTASNDFSFISSQGLVDAGLLFWGLLAVYLALSRNKWAVAGSGVATGLAIMTKSTAAFWIPVLALPLIYDQGKWRAVGQWLLAVVVVAEPWHVFMLAKYGNEFVNRYLLANLTGRTGGAAGNIAPIYWYLIYMLDQWKMMMMVAPVLIGGWWATRKQWPKGWWWLGWWVAVIIIPFSLAKSKVWWYIYPAWPAVSILMAWLMVKLVSTKPSLSWMVLIMVGVSQLSYWQLSVGHIPWKQYLGLAVVVGLASWVVARMRIKAGLGVVVPVLVMLAVMNWNTWKMALARGDVNHDLKILASKNKGLSGLAVQGIPYEAALFYFDCGTIDRVIGSDSKYVLTRDGQEKFTLVSI